MPSPMPPPPPNEEDMKRYEKEVAELEDAHGIWQYGKYWPDIKELKKKMEDIGFVTPNSDNCYTFKSEYDEKYYSMPDDDATNQLFSLFGEIPFGTDIAKIIVEEGTGNKFIDPDGINSTDLLSLLKYSAEPVVETLGKAAGIVSHLATAYNIGETLISDSAEINQLTQKIDFDFVNKYFK